MAEKLTYHPILKSSELPEGKRQLIKIKGFEVIVLRLGGKLFAIDSYCTHEHESLVDGDIEEGEIVCPFHGARFEIESGKATGFPAVVDLNTYPIREKDGNIEIALPINKA